MAGILSKLFSKPNKAPDAYERAMSISDSLLERMQNHSHSNEPALGVMADLWAQRNNVPFMTTVVETVQEMKAPLYQSPLDQ